MSCYRTLRRSPIRMRVCPLRLRLSMRIVMRFTSWALGISRSTVCICCNPTAGSTSPRWRTVNPHTWKYPHTGNPSLTVLTTSTPYIYFTPIRVNSPTPPNNPTYHYSTSPSTPTTLSYPLSTCESSPAVVVFVVDARNDPFTLGITWYAWCCTFERWTRSSCGPGRCGSSAYFWNMATVRLQAQRLWMSCISSGCSVAKSTTSGSFMTNSAFWLSCP